MQRAKDEVSGFGRLDRDGDRLEIPHLADEHDVRVFAQRGAQRVLEPFGVGVHLALVDEAPLVLVYELDRIFNRDQMIITVLVDVVDHGAERGRFSRSGRTGDEHEPLVQLAHLEDRRRQPELFGGEDAGRDDAEDRAGAALIFEEADAFFARRTEVKDSNDRHANADTNHLLQLMETHDGLVILSTNRRANIDPAFIRRLRHVVEFPKPGPVVFVNEEYGHSSIYPQECREWSRKSRENVESGRDRRATKVVCPEARTICPCSFG